MQRALAFQKIGRGTKSEAGSAPPAPDRIAGQQLDAGNEALMAQGVFDSCNQFANARTRVSWFLPARASPPVFLPESLGCGPRSYQLERGCELDRLVQRAVQRQRIA